MPIKKMCVHCGKEFIVPPARKETARFCSPQCKNEHGGWGKKQVELTCLYCGRKFKSWEAWLKKDASAGKYCSRTCKNEAQKRTDIPVPKFIEDYKAGLSSIQIASKYNVADVIVRRRLHEANIEMRTAKEGILLAYKNLHGPKHKNWKGPRLLKNGRTKDKKYWLIYIPDHPRADKRGYVYEHVYIWEKANKKSVPTKWVVHHKNLKETDNRPENLEAMSRSAHTKLHNDLREQELRDAKKRIFELEQEVERLKAKNN